MAGKGPTFYCPSCWSRVSATDHRCPACGADVDAEARKPYGDRLISALRHPLRENRMMAIQLLGDLRADKAIAALGNVVRGVADYHASREALAALAKIGTDEARAIIREAAEHHVSTLVRRYAARKLREAA